jgi:hypothetical protein
MLDDWTFTNPRPIHAAQEIVPILESVTEAEESTVVTRPQIHLGPPTLCELRRAFCFAPGWKGLFCVARSAKQNGGEEGIRTLDTGLPRITV